MAELHSDSSPKNMQNGTDRYADRMESGTSKYAGEMHDNSVSFVNSPMANERSEEQTFRDYKDFENARRGKERYEERYEQMADEAQSTSSTNNNASNKDNSEKYKEKIDKYQEKMDKYRGKLERIEERQSAMYAKKGSTKRVRGIVHKMDQHFAAGGALLKAENLLLKADDVASGALKISISAASPLTRMAQQGAMRASYSAGAENAGVKLALTGAEFGMQAYRAGRSAVNLVNQKKRFKKEFKTFKYERQAEKLSNKIDKKMLQSAIANERMLLNSENNSSSRSEKKKSWKRLFSSDGRSNLFEKSKKSEKKKTLRKFYSSADGKSNYLEKPQKSVLDSEKMSRRDIRYAKQGDKIDKKYFKQAKKVYQTTTVKEAYINPETGRVKFRSKKVVDTSKKRMTKPQRPDSLLAMATMGSVNLIGRKAANEAYAKAKQSDDAATQGAVLGLQFGSNRLRDLKRLSQSSQKRKSLSKERASKRAETQMNKLDNEKKRLAQKKAAQKKHQNAENGKKVRNKMKKSRQRAEQAVKKAIVGTKTKLMVVGGAAIIVMLLLPVFLIPLLGGGSGGGTGILGGIEAVTVYNTNDRGLVDFNEQYNELLWSWENLINNKMNDYSKNDTEEWEIVTNPCLNNPYYAPGPNGSGSTQGITEHPDNVYTVIHNVYDGEVAKLSDYDIRLLYAYFTVKYHEEWGSITDELWDIFDMFYELKCDEANGDVTVDEDYDLLLDTHYTYVWQADTLPPDAPAGTTPGGHYVLDKTEEHHVHITNKIKHYKLYPKVSNITEPISEYIKEQLKEIGEIEEDGVSTGEKHFDMLMISLGGHQKLNDCIKVDGEYYDWKELGGQFGEYGVLKNLNENSTVNGVQPDYRYEKNADNSLTIEVPAEEIEIVASGFGVITEKTENSITIEYSCEGETLTIVYEGSTVTNMTPIGVGSIINDGIHLFCVNRAEEDTEEDEDTEPPVSINPSIKLSAHLKGEYIDSDINPALMFIQQDPEMIGK